LKQLRSTLYQFLQLLYLLFITSKNNYMKQTILSFCMLLLSVCVFGQARDGTAAYRQTSKGQPVAMIYLPYAPEVVIAAMDHYKAQDYRAGKVQSKAYQSFQNTLLVQNNVHYADMIFKVGLKDIEDQNVSVLYLMLNAPIEHVNHSGTEHHFDMQQAIGYLDNLALAIRSYAFDKQIKQQTSVLGRAEANQVRTVNQGNKMNSRKAHMYNRVVNLNRGSHYKSDRLNLHIIENQAAQVTQKAEIERQKQDLILLTSQRTE
jgi:hypothetical protein